MSDVASVRSKVEEHFPNLWLAVDLGLATAATLLVKENANPVAVIYVGDQAQVRPRSRAPAHKRAAIERLALSTRFAPRVALRVVLADWTGDAP